MKNDDAEGAVILTQREAAALAKAAVDSVLLAAGLEWPEIIVLRCKLIASSKTSAQKA